MKHFYVYDLVEDTFKTNFNTESRRTYSVRRYEYFSLTLPNFNYCGNWDLPGHMFKVEGPPFERILISVI